MIHQDRDLFPVQLTTLQKSYHWLNGNTNHTDVSSFCQWRVGSWLHKPVTCPWMSVAAAAADDGLYQQQYSCWHLNRQPQSVYAYSPSDCCPPQHPAHLTHAATFDLNTAKHWSTLTTLYLLKSKLHPPFQKILTKFDPLPRMVLPAGKYKENLMQQFFSYLPGGSIVCLI